MCQLDSPPTTQTTKLKMIYTVFSGFALFLLAVSAQVPTDPSPNQVGGTTPTATQLPPEEKPASPANTAAQQPPPVKDCSDEKKKITDLLEQRRKVFAVLCLNI